MIVMLGLMIMNVFPALAVAPAARSGSEVVELDIDYSCVLWNSMVLVMAVRLACWGLRFVMRNKVDDDEVEDDAGVKSVKE